MKCPKCDEGVIKKVLFKTNGKIAFVCDGCDALWFEDELIGPTSGHTLRSYSQENNLEYSIEDLDEKDQEHRPLE